MRPARGHPVSQCKAANSSTRFNTFPLPQISHGRGWLILGAIRQLSELADTLRHRYRTSVHLTSSYSYLPVDWFGIQLALAWTRKHVTKEVSIMKNIVLVHGGFVDGAGWEGVYKILKKDGYNVTIVQNPTIS